MKPPGSAATALRWRSRLAKEAVPQQGDDSQLLAVPSAAEDYGLDENKKKKKLSSGSWCSPHYVWTVLAALSTAVSFAVLEVDLRWQTAVASTLQIVLSAVLVQAVSRLRRLGSLGQHVKYTRQRLQSLKLHNERYRRRLQQLDVTHDRLRAVQADIARIVGPNQDVAQHMIRMVHTWRVVQLQLRQQLTQQVQGEIIRVVLDADHDGNFVLDAAEVERLLLRLQNLPGVTLDETAIRNFWHRYNDDAASVHTIVRLLAEIAVQDGTDLDNREDPTKSKNSLVELDTQAWCQAQQNKTKEQVDLISF
jgi:hypothetical protein